LSHTKLKEARDLEETVTKEIGLLPEPSEGAVAAFGH
jgi:hypothetical protein